MLWRFALIILLIIPTHSYASKVALTQGERERVVECKHMLAEVEPKSAAQLIADIERTKFPSVNVQIKEAVAWTYTDIIKEQNVKDLGKKKWLYSMVALNMAYVQLSGLTASTKGAEPINALIVKKLKAYLPAALFEREGFLYSLD